MFHRIKRFVIFALTDLFRDMRLETMSFNKKMDATTYITQHGIEKDQILTFYQEQDGTYTLMYYVD